MLCKNILIWLSILITLVYFLSQSENINIMNVV